MADKKPEQLIKHPEDFATVTVPKELIGPIAKLYDLVEAKHTGPAEIHFRDGVPMLARWPSEQRFDGKGQPE